MFKGLVKLKSTDREFWVWFDDEKELDPTFKFWAFQDEDKQGPKIQWFSVDDIYFFEYRLAK